MYLSAFFSASLDTIDKAEMRNTPNYNYLQVQNKSGVVRMVEHCQPLSEQE